MTLLEFFMLIGLPTLLVVWYFGYFEEKLRRKPKLAA